MERQPAQKRLADQNLAQDAARTTRFETQVINGLQRVSKSKTARIGTLGTLVATSAIAFHRIIEQPKAEAQNLPSNHLELTSNQLQGTSFDPEIFANLIVIKTEHLSEVENSVLSLVEAAKDKVETERSKTLDQLTFAGPTVIETGEGISQALKRDLKTYFDAELTPEQYFEGAKALAADNNKTGDINLVNTGDPFVWGEKTLVKLAEFGISGSSQVTTQASIENINTDTTIIFENSGEDTTSEFQTEVTVNNQVENLGAAVTSAQNSGEVSSAGVPLPDPDTGEGDLPTDDGGPPPGPGEGDLPSDDGGPQPGPDEGDLPTTEPKPDDPPDVATPKPKEHPTLPPIPTPKEHPTLPPTSTPKFHATPTPPKKDTPTPHKKETPTPPKKETATPTKRATETPTRTPTNTPTETATPPKKETPTPTPKKATDTPTPTSTLTTTATATASPTATSSRTPPPTSEVIPSRLPPTGAGHENTNYNLGLMGAILGLIFGFLLSFGWILRRKYNSRGGEVSDK